MTLTILSYALGNTLLALPLAVLARAIGRTARHPAVVHFMWVLVMIRLVMPPVAALSWLSIQVPMPGALVARPVASLPAASPIHVAGPAGPLPEVPGASPTAPWPAGQAPLARVIEPPAPAVAIDRWTALGMVWLAGTGLVVGVSAVRLRRFTRLLRGARVPPDQRVGRLAARAAADLGMPLSADIALIPASAVPFVWGFLGRPSIVLPGAIAAEMSDDDLRLVLMHELAHVRRRDHLVRWLDWAVVAWLWWNPLAWIARNGLRATEELACDAFVLRTRGAEPRSYGGCLLAVSEALAGASIRTPVQACAMGDGGALGDRIRFIMSGASRNRPSLSLRLLAVAMAGLSIAAGIVCVGPGEAAEEPRQQAPVAAVAPGPGRGGRTLEASIEDARSLHVEVVSGSIAIHRDDTVASMEVSAVIEGKSFRLFDGGRQALVDGATLVAEKNADGGVTVRVDFPEMPPGRRQWPSVAITIRAAALESVHAATTNGKIETTGDLGSLHVESTNGTIDISEAGSAVRAASVNGTVRIALADGAAAPVDAECTNGRIALELPPTWDGLVDASTTVGSVTVRNLDGKTTRTITGARFRSAGGAAEGPVASLGAVNGSIEVRKR